MMSTISTGERLIVGRSRVIELCAQSAWRDLNTTLVLYADSRQMLRFNIGPRGTLRWSATRGEDILALRSIRLAFDDDLRLNDAARESNEHLITTTLIYEEIEKMYSLGHARLRCEKCGCDRGFQFFVSSLSIEPGNQDVHVECPADGWRPNDLTVAAVVARLWSSMTTTTFREAMNRQAKDFRERRPNAKINEQANSR